MRVTAAALRTLPPLADVHVFDTVALRTFAALPVEYVRELARSSRLAPRLEVSTLDTECYCDTTPTPTRGFVTKTPSPLCHAHSADARARSVGRLRLPR